MECLGRHDAGRHVGGGHGVFLQSLRLGYRPGYVHARPLLCGGVLQWGFGRLECRLRDGLLQHVRRLQRVHGTRTGPLEYRVRAKSTGDLCECCQLCRGCVELADGSRDQYAEDLSRLFQFRRYWRRTVEYQPSHNHGVNGMFFHAFHACAVRNHLYSNICSSFPTPWFSLATFPVGIRVA